MPLSIDLFYTLETVRILAPAHAEQVAEHMNYEGHVTAINNRLTDLMALGFLTRERRGKRYFYTLTLKPK